MNWLAHVFLSKPDIEFRLGNLLADLVKGRDRTAMTASFMDGVCQHQVIDVFTDCHPIVHRSRRRIGVRYQQVAGILVDVFYDHFLAVDWDRYCTEPLEKFTARLYADLRAHPMRLSVEARTAVDRMIGDDRLGSYRRIDGVEAALRRVSMRLLARVGRDFKLESAVSELRDNFDELASDFGEFFPLLQVHVGKSKEAEPRLVPRNNVGEE